MPFHDLNSDDRGSDEIRWTAGGRTDVTILIDGERIARREVQKGQRVIIAYEDATDPDKMIKEDN
jgi:hypothetical protein